MNIELFILATCNPSSKTHCSSSEKFHKRCKLAGADIQFGAPRDSRRVEWAMTQEEKSVYSVYFGKSAVTGHWPGSRNWYLHEVNLLKNASWVKSLLAQLNSGLFRLAHLKLLSTLLLLVTLQREVVVITHLDKNFNIHGHTESKIGDWLALNKHFEACKLVLLG